MTTTRGQDASPLELARDALIRPDARPANGLDDRHDLHSNADRLWLLVAAIAALFP